MDDGARDVRTGERPRETAESFTTLFEAATEGMLILEGEIIVAANHTATMILGRDAEALSGLIAFDLIAPEEQGLARAHRPNPARTYETVIVRPDGGRVPVQIISRRISYGGGDARLVTLQDITERRAAEERLRASESRFRALVQHASELTIIRDLDGTIRYMSPAAERIFGYTAEELTGRNRLDLIHPEDAVRIADAVDRIQRTPGVHAPISYRVRHRDGTWRTLEGTATNLLHEPSVRGILVNARDVTERAEAERERDATLARERRARQDAEEALRARDEFLAVAAHELKTPITAMKGNAELLARQLARPAPDPQQLTRLSTRITGQIERLEYLIGDLLDLSRLRRGQLLLRPRSCDLVALTCEVLARVTATLPDHGPTLHLDAPAAAILRADNERLEQVLLNLIGNAIKYSPAGGEIRIGIAMVAHTVRLTVRDQGIGIPLEEQATIFEPFTRSSLATAVATGIGIGLYITAQIVAGHGGTITVESSPGLGSCFTVTLPIDGPPT
jgi:PAS domain S-box-containing protein